MSVEISFSFTADCQVAGEARELIHTALGGDYPTSIPSVQTCGDLLARLHRMHPTGTFVASAPDYKLSVGPDGAVRCGRIVWPQPGAATEAAP